MYPINPWSLLCIHDIPFTYIIRSHNSVKLRNKNRTNLRKLLNADITLDHFEKHTHSTMDTISAVCFEIAQDNIQEVGPIFGEIIVGDLGNNISAHHTNFGLGISKALHNDFTHSILALMQYIQVKRPRCTYIKHD